MRWVSWDRAPIRANGSRPLVSLIHSVSYPAASTRWTWASTPSVERPSSPDHRPSRPRTLTATAYRAGPGPPIRPRGPPAALGGVHPLVRLVDHVVELGPRAGRRGADGQAQRQAGLGHLPAAGGSPDAVDEDLGASLVGLRQQDEEFVAADPGDHIRGARFERQDLRRPPDEDISLRVAKPVVGELEAVTSTLMTEHGRPYRSTRSASTSRSSYQWFRLASPVRASVRASRANRSRSSARDSRDEAWLMSSSAASASARPMRWQRLVKPRGRASAWATIRTPRWPGRVADGQRQAGDQARASTQRVAGLLGQLLLEHGAIANAIEEALRGRLDLDGGGRMPVTDDDLAHGAPLALQERHPDVAGEGLGGDGSHVARRVGDSFGPVLHEGPDGVHELQFVRQQLGRRDLHAGGHELCRQALEGGVRFQDRRGGTKDDEV